MWISWQVAEAEPSVYYQKGITFSSQSRLTQELHPDSTVCIDEPDNFVALAEIEPWLELVREKCAESNAQVLLISHHPEVINRLAGECGLVFYRDGAGPARVRPFEAPAGNTLLPAEIVARGWEHA